MIYKHIQKGIFLSRPNRFIAHILITSEETGKECEVICHVKNTGRCRELLLPGSIVLLQFHPQALAMGRKTQYSLIGVYKEVAGGQLLINMDSQAPNQVAAEWLFSLQKSGENPQRVQNEYLSPENIRREVTYGSSRFDLAFDLAANTAAILAANTAANTAAVLATEPAANIENSAPGLSTPIRHAFMEVKGVTLEDQGIAMFPDAPTDRGLKHVLELIRAAQNGYEAYILFVIQMKNIKIFTPNRQTHPQFGDALIAAQSAGVHILAYDCIVTENSLVLDAPVPIKLEETS